MHPNEHLVDPLLHVNGGQSTMKERQRRDGVRRVQHLSRRSYWPSTMRNLITTEAIFWWSLAVGFLAAVGVLCCALIG